MIILKGGDKGPAHNLIDELSPDKPWKITAQVYRKKRVDPQNRFYWGFMIRPMCDETGNDPNDLHEYLCGEYFGWVEYRVYDRVQSRPARGTSDLNTEEFEQYRLWVQTWAAKLGIILPNPNEVVT